MHTIIKRCHQGNYTFEDLKYLLSVTSEEQTQLLLNEAYQVKCAEVKPIVNLRGIIEFSNICHKDCHYCGIRKSNEFVTRFFMQKDEILESAKWAFKKGYGSIVLQSGERCDLSYVDFVEDCLYAIKEITKGKLGVTLSLGEQTYQTYNRWFKAGAHRYLLRLETSNESLYNQLHPDDHSFLNRKKCLDVLRKVGYQVGTGVMIGLPGQNIDSLVQDVLFFKDNDIDMIGMGPYIKHPDTPMASLDLNLDVQQRFDLALKMIAVCRLVLRDVNIAATTALQAIDAMGREKGIKAGANVIMPNLSDIKYRDKYYLYAGKPCTDENASQCRDCLENRILSIGETINYNHWGDSPHFKKRQASCLY